MCGIAGLIHRGKSTNVGGEMQNMLQSLKHRGPDSTGYALYGDKKSNNYILRSLNRIYVEFVRAIPLLPMLFWVFYGLPVVFKSLGINIGIKITKTAKANVSSETPIKPKRKPATKSAGIVML